MDDADELALGLRRVVFETDAGPVVTRVGREGRDTATLLIHGAAGSWRGWVPLLRVAAERGDPVDDVVAVDLPGWGESADPTTPLTDVAAADAVAQVARALGAVRWSVAGHSLGGLVALTLATREAAATERVLLVSPTGPAVLDAIRRPLRGGLRLPWFAGMLVAMRVLAALPGGGRPVLRTVERIGLLGRLAGPLFARDGAVDPAVLGAFGTELRPAAFLRAARAAASVDPASWQSIRVPVRSVRGVRDRFAGTHDRAALAALLPDFGETTLERAGHFALAERPGAVLDLLRRR